VREEDTVLKEFLEVAVPVALIVALFIVGCIIEARKGIDR
jgi:hypothetical protein